MSTNDLVPLNLQGAVEEKKTEYAVDSAPKYESEEPRITINPTDPKSSTIDKRYLFSGNDHYLIGRDGWIYNRYGNLIKLWKDGKYRLSVHNPDNPDKNKQKTYSPDEINALKVMIFGSA